MSITSDELKNKTDSELALIQSRNHFQSEEYILAEKEWQRRERVEQHKLDIALMSKQLRSNRFYSILGVIAVIVGAIVGATATAWFQYKPQYKIQQQPQLTTPGYIQSKTEVLSEQSQKNQYKTINEKEQNDKKAKGDFFSKQPPTKNGIR